MALIPPPLDGARDLPALVRLVREWGAGLLRSLRLPALSERGVVLQAQLQAGTNLLSHGLGRPPSGWLVLRLQGTTGCALAEVASDSTTLALHATQNAAVTLWVWP